LFSSARTRYPTYFARLQLLQFLEKGKAPFGLKRVSRRAKCMRSI
jgi:hypothetical protein